MIGCDQGRAVERPEVGPDVDEDERGVHGFGAFLHDLPEGGENAKRPIKVRVAQRVCPFARQDVFEARQRQIAGDEAEAFRHPLDFGLAQIAHLGQRFHALMDRPVFRRAVPQGFQSILVEE